MAMYRARQFRGGGGRGTSRLYFSIWASLKFSRRVLDLNCVHRTPQSSRVAHLAHEVPASVVFPHPQADLQKKDKTRLFSKTCGMDVKTYTLQKK